MRRETERYSVTGQLAGEGRMPNQTGKHGIRLKGTFKDMYGRLSAGTLILDEIQEDNDNGNLITGIAGKKGYCVITISKTGLSSESGALLRILEIVNEHGVNVEYIPSGIDIVSLVMSEEKVKSCLYAMLGEIQKTLSPDSIKVTEHLAIVAAVGRRMASRPGVSGRIFATLGENGVNIRMITQGPEELNIIVGVEEKDFAQVIRVLYDTFMKE